MKNNFAQLMLDVNQEVFLERMRQNEKWGIQRHNNGRWLAILVEEVGESAEAMQDGMISQKETDSNNLYEELIQVAAVASAWAEQIKEEQEGGNEIKDIQGVYNEPPKENRPTGFVVKEDFKTIKGFKESWERLGTGIKKFRDGE